MSHLEKKEAGFKWKIMLYLHRTIKYHRIYNV